MAYATEALVEQIEDLITLGSASTDIMTVAAMESIAEEHVDPVINAALGLSETALTSPSKVLKKISAMWTVAHILQDKHGQSGKVGERIQWLHDEGWKLIEMIKAGELTISDVATQSPITAAEPDDEFLEQEIFIYGGDRELDWDKWEETREDW